MKQLGPISESPEPITGQEEGLGIPIDPAEATRRLASLQQDFRVPPHPDCRIKVPTTRPRQQDGHRLAKQDGEVPTLDNYRPLGPGGRAGPNDLIAESSSGKIGSASGGLAAPSA